MSGRVARLSHTTRTVAIVLVIGAFLAMPSVALAKKPGTDPAPTARPYVESISSYAAPRGSEVTIYGTGFGPVKKSSIVTFAGMAGNIVSWTDTEIVVAVPNRCDAGYIGVVVDDVWSNGVFFVPALPPAISGLSADNAPPGETITISGSAFDSDQGSGSVTIAGVTADVVSWSGTEIIVVVPEGAPAGYVGVWQNTLCSNGAFFVPGSVPAIESASTSMALVDDTVTITGQNFGPAPDAADSVTVGGVPAAPTSWSDTSITFTVPETATTGYIGVWRYDRNLCSNGQFLLVAPRIESVSSWWGEPGSVLTVQGVGFGNTPDRITFADIDAAVVSWTDTQITATIPSGALQGYVGVWRGSACSNGIWFLATTQPIIASVDATSVVPGQLVTIDGSNFETQTQYSQVTMGGAECEIVSWSDTRIVARMPAVIIEGYLGAWKYGVASNGWYLPVATTP